MSSMCLHKQDFPKDARTRCLNKHRTQMKMNADKITAMYFIRAATFGFVRKVFQLQNATVRTYDYKKQEEKRLPMLLVDKVAVVGASTILSPVLLPIFVYNDLKSLEMFVLQLVAV